jgi:hypothetical protein
MSLRDFIDQASAETRVKYGPELSALAQLLQNAETDYSASRSAAAGSAAGIQRAVQQAVPFVQNAYQQAGGVQSTANTLLSQDLQGLGPVAGGYKAAAATEAGAAQSRLAGAGAAATADLGSRYARATDTANYMRQKALADLSATKGQIGNRLQALAQEEGSFTQGRVAGLQNDSSKLQAQADRLKAQQGFTAQQNALNRDVTKRGQDLSHSDRRTSAAKGKWAPQAKQGEAQSQVASALNFAKQFAGHLSRQQAAQYLLSGQKSQPVYDTVKTPKGTKQVRRLNPDGTPVQGREVPSFDPLWASIALDVAYDGGISHYNVGRLIDRGIKPGSIGFPTQQQRGLRIGQKPTGKTPGFPVLPRIAPHQLKRVP